MPGKSPSRLRFRTFRKPATYAFHAPTLCTLSQAVMDRAATLEHLVAESRELYSLPAVAVEVLELTADPTVDATRLKACLLRDPALTARLLRVVNSSLFGLSGQVSDLGQALTLLGVKPLKLLVLGFSLPQALTRGIEVDVLSRYWKHSLTKAVAARELSRMAKGVSSDEAFLAGLLSDLGQLVLIQGLGRPYAQVLDRVQTSHRDLAAVERHVLGFDHTELTVQLLTSWRFPPTLIDAVVDEAAPYKRGAAEKPSRHDDGSALGRVLHLAELLARLLADDQTELLPEVATAGKRDFHLSEAELFNLCGSLGDTVAQLADVLGLGLSRELDYLAVIERAHSQLSHVAADAAIDLLRIKRNGLAADGNELTTWEEVEQLRMALAEPPKAEPVPVAVAARPVMRSGVATFRPQVVTEEKRIDKPLAAAVIACREARRPLSLLLGAVTAADDLEDEAGLLSLSWVVRWERFCGELSLPGAQWLQIGAQRFALVLPDCERQQAVNIGYDIIRELQQLCDTGQETWTISVGIAAVPTPPRHFTPDRLIEAAERCIHAAQSAGGSRVKSIEIL